MNLQGTYTDIQKIGSGGGGTVFRAFHVRMQKNVVLKKIHDNIKGNVDIRGELDILKNLRHEYLPTVLDFIEDEDAIYTVMDYIPGESFQNLLDKGVQFTQTQVVKYAAQLGQVLGYLHGQNTPIIHGDIKPANIMLTPEDNICLIDFNISQLQNGIVSRNMGYTPGYASPEQTHLVLNMRQSYAAGTDGAAGGTVLLHEGSEKKEAAPLNLADRIDVRSDIYSAGATLYAILSGKKPSADFSSIVPIEKLVKNCSEGLAYLIGKSMQIRPEERFQNSAEFAGAVSNIAKVDKRYRRLVLRQNLMAVCCMFGAAFFVFLAILGKEQMAAEKVAVYNGLVGQMEGLADESGSEEALEKLYREACAMFPEKADAYYQKAAKLYQKREYTELERFVSEEALVHMGSFTAEETASFYFLLANTCLEQDNLEDALSYYRTAVKYDDSNVTYYSDYAIALTRSGDLKGAKAVLAEAVDKGLSNDKVLLAQGEIADRQGNLEEAAERFAQCIAETGDSYVLLRAYVMWGKLYDENPDEKGLLKKVSVLKEGVNAVAESDRAVVLELLAQGYIDLGAMTGEDTYNLQALECFREITGLGWDTYLTHNNMGILYEMTGDYKAAEQEFFDMLHQYGENYRTYKRLAFLEIDIQSVKDTKDRNYEHFEELYEKAVQLFESSGIREDADMEMKRLEQVREQLKEGKWLD